jgi:hypothetical protein
MARLSSSQVGDFGEETVAAILESRGDTVVAKGGSQMPRDSGRQDLDLVAIVDGEFVAFEVKSRYYGTLAGRIAPNGNLPRPRLGRPRLRVDGSRGVGQATREYVLARVEQFIEVDEETDVAVRLVIVDLKANVAQEFDMVDGAIGRPFGPPFNCRDDMRVAIDEAFGSDSTAARIAASAVLSH